MGMEFLFGMMKMFLDGNGCTTLNMLKKSLNYKIQLFLLFYLEKVLLTKGQLQNTEGSVTITYFLFSL